LGIGAADENLAMLEIHRLGVIGQERVPAPGSSTKGKGGEEYG
jgi:hypothetical protein